MYKLLCELSIIATYIILTIKRQRFQFLTLLLDSNTNLVLEMSTLSKEDVIREEVITTAQKLFQHYGFAKTTMEDIAKAMGRGKSTLYNYYKSKDEIFNAVAFREASEVFNTIQEAIDKVDSAEEKLQVYLETNLQTVKTKLNLYGLIMDGIGVKEGYLLKENFQNPMLKFNDKEIETIKGILQLGIDNEEFNERLKNNVDLMAYVIITALRSIILDLVFSNKAHYSFFDEDKINAMSQILIKGLKK